VRYRDYVTREILNPLGMRSSVWSPDDVPPGRLATAYAAGPEGQKKIGLWRLGASESAGGLFSTLRDMARYAAFQLSAYPPRSDAESGPVRRSSVREGHTLQHRTDLAVDWHGAGQDLRVTATASGIGLAWWSYETCDLDEVVWHSGGTEGFRGTIHLLPQRGVALILLTNYINTNSHRIVDKALDLLLASGGLTRRSLLTNPELDRTMGRLASLYASFSEKGYEEVFAQSFKDAVPLAKAEAVTRELQAAHGACKDPVPIEVRSKTSGRYRLPCEHGWIEYDFTLGPDGAVKDADTKSHGIEAEDPTRGHCPSR
jgi:CubicO group peptidase (beta-lactamase class C family)